MRTGRTRAVRRLALPAVVALCVPGCRPELPDPPDPNEETPAVSCEQGGPLGLERTAALTDQAQPSWFEACTVCPVDSLEVSLVDGQGASVPAFAAWTEPGVCAAVLPLADPSGEAALAATVRLVDGERAGEFAFGFDLAAPLDPAPDLGAAVFKLDWAEARALVPGLAALPAEAPRPFLFALADTPSGAGPAVLARTDEEGRRQAACEPTFSPAGALHSTDGRLTLPLAPGDRIPFGGALIAQGGALRARAAEDGSGLRDVTLALRVDLAAMQPIWGHSPEEACAALGDPTACGPCADPADGAEGEPLCLTAVWEWTSALRTGASVTPISEDDLPPECLGDDDDSATDRADPGDDDSAR